MPRGTHAVPREVFRLEITERLRCEINLVPCRTPRKNSYCQHLDDNESGPRSYPLLSYATLQLSQNLTDQHILIQPLVSSRYALWGLLLNRL